MQMQKEEEAKQEDSMGAAMGQEQPAAGKQAFTSVKYSGQPPGGKSNFSLG